MTKKDIVCQVARDVKVRQFDVKKVVQRALECIKESLLRGETVELRNFGVFKVKERRARKGRNPRTGVEVPVPPRKVITFKSGILMKKKLNSG